MSLASTSQYYVTVDSQFKDQEKYPLDTDFGVSFQTKNPNLNYPQGLPIDPSQPFPRVTIDKNFDSIGIQVKGGKITEYTVDSVTGDIIFSGVTVRGDDNGNQVARDFLILYNGNILFSLLASLYHITPFICRVSSSYIPQWLIMIKQKPIKSNTTLDSTFKLISNSSLYFMFDYTMFSGLNSNLGRTTDLIYFEKYTYSSFYPDNNNNIVTVKTLNYSFENYYTNYLYNPLLEETKPVLGVFAFDINGNPLQINGHPWGYHQFAMNTYYYGQTFSMIPSNGNGRNVITVDKGDNLYAGVNINPFDISLENNTIYNTTPYYKCNISNIKKPIFFSLPTNQNIESMSLGSINLNPTQTTNMLVYYLGNTSNDIYQLGGADAVGLLKVNITSPSFSTTDKNLETDLLSSYPINIGSFISNNSVLPVSLVGDSNDQSSFSDYNVGTIFNISNYQYYEYPSPLTQGNGIMTIDKQFSYTGAMTSISTLNLTGTNVSKEYINVLTTLISTPYRMNLYSYLYTYTGNGNSSLDLIASNEINSGYNYDYSSYNSKVANWFEGNDHYIAYALRGDTTNNGSFNTIFINTLNISSGTIDSAPTNNIINIKKGLITDFQAFTIHTKVFLILVSDSVTYVFKRDYTVSSSWETITIPNNSHYVIPKIKRVGSSYRIYLVSCNMIFNTSNVYSIPYKNGYTYYYQIGSEYRFAQGENAIVSVTDNIISLGRTLNSYFPEQYDSVFNIPRGFTFQDKIVDSQHIYSNNSYVSVLPTENISSREVIGIKTLTVNGTTYLFTLRYEDSSIANVDIFYMDGFTPIFITTCQLTKSDIDALHPDFRVYYIPDETNDINGVPYGQDRGPGSGCIVIVLSPNKLDLTSGVKIAFYSVVSSTELVYVDQASIDGGSPVYNSWIYNYNGVYYLVNNITDLSTSSSSFNFYSIDYKYRFSFISNETLSGVTYYITAGEIYYNYTDRITGQSGPVLLCYYSTSSSSRGDLGVMTLIPSTPGIGMLLGVQLPSTVTGYSQPAYISVDRNRQLNNYGIVSISWGDYTYLINIQDNGTLTLSSEVISGYYVSVSWNSVLNKLFVTLFSQTNSNNALVYDVTNAGTSNDIVTFSAQIDTESVVVYNNYISSNSRSPLVLYAAQCNQSVILFTSSLISKLLLGSTLSSPTTFFPSILTYDLSNPSFANLYQTPTKVSNNITTYGNGNALLVKLQNDGQTIWNMSLGDSGNYSYTSPTSTTRNM
jgi:hypothetical protein